MNYDNSVQFGGMSGSWGTNARAGHNSRHGQMPEAAIWDTGFAAKKIHDFRGFLGKHRGLRTFSLHFTAVVLRWSHGAALSLLALLFFWQVLRQNMLRMPRQVWTKIFSMSQTNSLIDGCRYIFLPFLFYEFEQIGSLDFAIINFWQRNIDTKWYVSWWSNFAYIRIRCLKFIPVFSRRILVENVPDSYSDSFFRRVRSTFLFICSTTSNLSNFEPQQLEPQKRVQNEKKKPNRRTEPRNHTEDPPIAPTFFGTMRLFLKLLGLHQRVPLHFFRHFATQCMSKIPKGPPFTFFGTVTLFKNLIKKFFLGNFFQVPKKLPFNFLSYFATSWSFTKPEGSPFSQFWALDVEPTLAVFGFFWKVPGIFTRLPYGSMHRTMILFSRRFS